VRILFRRRFQSSPFSKLSLRMLRMRRTGLHLLSGTNRICGVANDFVCRREITEDLDTAVHTQTCDHIHPFRLPISYSLDEGALLVIGHGGNRHKHSWSSAMDRPLHRTETARRQAPILALNVQLNGHRPGIRVHVMRNPRNGCVERLSGISRNAKHYLLTRLRTGVPRHFPKRFDSMFLSGPDRKSER
jgi:hypothetical protein